MNGDDFRVFRYRLNGNQNSRHLCLNGNIVGKTNTNKECVNVLTQAICSSVFVFMNTLISNNNEHDKHTIFGKKKL